MATSSPQRASLSQVLPPLIFGTATFNYQYNPDPYNLDSTGLVQRALELGIRAFDTSPYYGPSEQILGDALDTDFVHAHVPRHEYFLLTKVGRVGAETFDYSKKWIAQSVENSLQRLKTNYVDLVYCHDVEFVSEDETLEAVKELRRMRDEEGTVRYIGISGYPLPVLISLAHRVRMESGEPLDAVMSYANFTLQNTSLASKGIAALRAAGVDVVLNASPLGMGLLRREGVPSGSLGDWHPATPDLRNAVRRASQFCDQYDERIEVIAIRYALEQWLKLGSSVGSRGDPASGAPRREGVDILTERARLGVSVMGVSRVEELEKTMQVWYSILDGLVDGAKTAQLAGRWSRAHEWSNNRERAVLLLAEEVQQQLGLFVDYTWHSPPKGFVNKARKNV